MNSHEVARWFIGHNPELASGYIDENTKVNKLVYLSCLMYYCVTLQKLFDEDFVAFPNGPVVFSIYRDYKYNGLNRFPKEVSEPDGVVFKVLNIINYVYGNCTAYELVEETHKHSLWQNVKGLIPNNPVIDLSKADRELIAYNRNIYKSYEGIDFDKLRREKISGNVYYYMADNLEMTDEIIQMLSRLDKFDEPRFLEIREGELVFS